MNSDLLHQSFSERLLICPCCNTGKTLQETPLLSIFQGDYYKFSFGKLITEETEIEKVIENCSVFLDWAAKAHKIRKNDILYHTKLWACSTCLDNNKAMLGRFSNQVPAFGGYILVYVRLNYTCQQCNEIFNFEPSEQQFWYEELKLHQDIRPKHCKACRSNIREIKKAQKKLMELHAKNAAFTTDELKELIECYKLIGAENKKREFEGRLKNKSK